MVRIRHYFVVFLKKALCANFLTNALYIGVKNKHSCLFTTIYTGKKKQIETNGHGAAGIFKGGSEQRNFPVLVRKRVKRINMSN